MTPSKTAKLRRIVNNMVIEHDSFDHERVQYDRLVYKSADMAALRVQLGARLVVDIWVSDEDLGHIYVDVPGQDISIRVPCREQHYAAGRTRWQHSKCKTMRRIRKDEGLLLSFSEARDKIDALVQADVAEQRHARRKKRTRCVERRKAPKSEEPSPSEAETVPDTGGRVNAAGQALMRGEFTSAPTLGQTQLSDERAHDAE